MKKIKKFKKTANTTGLINITSERDRWKGDKINAYSV